MNLDKINEKDVNLMLHSIVSDNEVLRQKGLNLLKSLIPKYKKKNEILINNILENSDYADIDSLIKYTFNELENNLSNYNKREIIDFVFDDEKKKFNFTCQLKKASDCMDISIVGSAKGVIIFNGDDLLSIVNDKDNICNVNYVIGRNQEYDKIKYFRVK